MARTKVQSELIATNAISGTIIADGAITSTHLAANCVDSSELVTGSIDTIHIAANQVTATKIVTNGVLTRHISDDQVTAAKLANSINTDIATGPAALPKAGGTMTGNILIGDNVKAIFGAGEDATIFSDGTSGYMRGFVLQNKAGNKDVLTFADGGATNLFHNNVKKLETKSTGVTVTGGISTNSSIHVSYSGNDGMGIDAGLKVQNDGNDWGTYIRKASAAQYGMRIDSAGSLALAIYGSEGGSDLNFSVTGSTGQVNVKGSTMEFDSSNDYMEFNKAVFSPIGYFVGTTGTKVGHLQNSSGVMLMEASTTRQIAFGNENNGEHVRIDADGNVGIGTNDPGDTLEVFTSAANKGITIKSGTGSSFENPTLTFIDVGNSTSTLAVKSDAFCFSTYGVTNALTITGSNGAITTNPAAGGHQVFNEGGNDADFRVESGDNPNMLFVDGGQNAIGINATDLGDDIPLTIMNIANVSDFSKVCLGIGGTEADDAVGVKSSIGFGYVSAARPIMPAVISYETKSTSGGTYGDLLFALRTDVGNTQPTERMRINSTGEVHITGAGAPINPTIKHSGATGDLAKLRLINRSGQGANKGGLLEMGAVTNDGVSRSDVFATVAGLKDNATSANRAGYMQFATSNGSALDEVMRLSSNGTLFVSNDIGSHSGGAASFAHNTYNHAAVFGRNSTPDGSVVIEDYDVSSGIGNTVLKCFLRDQDPANSATFIDFADAGGRVGSVTHNDDGGGVSFNTTSDYRLKENVNYTWDATTLLKQLKPAKFNFKRNPAKTVQGFLAHEVSSLVPSSVRGNKDHMMDIGTITDSEGITVYEGVYEHFCKEGQTWTKTGTEPLYQELDYSRLIPLLTKTVQEQQTVIESLTARIATLEG